MKYTLRIKKNNVFKYVFKKGIYSKGNFVVVHICKTKCFGQINANNFFAVCVSKKNGNSVKRNRLKRLAREVYKQEEQKIKRGYNIVIIYKKETSVDNVSFFNIRDDIVNCFKDLDLYE